MHSTVLQRMLRFLDTLFKGNMQLGTYMRETWHTNRTSKKKTKLFTGNL